MADAGAPVDSGAPVDAGSTDAGATDGGAGDASVDAGFLDFGPGNHAHGTATALNDVTRHLAEVVMNWTVQAALAGRSADEVQQQGR